MEWCEKAFPEIPWRDPLAMQLHDGTSGYACRICIAVIGFNANTDQDRILPSAEAVLAHIAEGHPNEQASALP